MRKRWLLLLLMLPIAALAKSFPYIQTPRILMGDWQLLADANVWLLRQDQTPRITILDEEITLGSRITGALALPYAHMTPIAAATHNYVPTPDAGGPACDDAAVWILSSDAARSITGIHSTTCVGNPGAVGARVVVLWNVGAFDITLEDEDAGSDTFNRFALTGDYALVPDGSITIAYDPTSARWRPLR